MSKISLAQIIGVFVREAHQRLAEMTRILDALPGGDPSALQELMRRFHSFAGIGGIDGFDVINSLAARGEAECRRMMAEGTKPSAEQIRRWSSVLDVLRAEVEELERSAATVRSMPGSERETRKVYEVLIVDDAAAVHEQLQPRLVAEGFRVHSAFTKAEAMECLLAIRPHALIADVRLPDGSGFDVVARFRDQDGRDRAPVFIISAGDEFLDKVAGIRAGADAYLSKPLDGKDVIHRLRSLVQARDEAVTRILSVEDDPDQALYLRTVLEGDGYEVRTCADPKQFEEDLVSFRPDLILMDILLPWVTGYELARFARQLDDYQTTPILFLTTDGQQQTRIESMRSGGDDHIQKPVSPNLLLATVQTRLERSRQIRHFLDRDSLTGLLNRTAFHRELQAWVRQPSAEGAAVVMIDVDRFKQINDSHGHAFGDAVLARLASFLRSNVRVSDSVCRYGGEEFTLLIDDVSQDEAVQLVDRLREEFGTTPQLAPDGTTIYVSFSSGVAPMAHATEGIPAALESADAALYRAKAAGRNRVFSSEELTPVRRTA